ncbi:hypothetical protein Tco_1092025 [Tanacetum coccineum]|uniref:Retrovirus-related Pol polyprotein from transposon TNT 1-94-like beta-barrel domain-containing protein n=1 Tax=Tanacetum coccineum TaxID=301880 RepID=A0ABQ5IAL9_9ASTR
MWYLDSGCSKHMTGNHSQLINFVYKFLGTVRFENDLIAKIMGYGDYQMGNVMISWVYYMEGLGHNLFSIGQFCDSDLEVAFRKHTCYIRDLEGLVPNPTLPTPYVPPTKKDWDTLFQLMFDDYFNPTPSVASPVPAVVSPIPADSTGLPSLTPVDQDAPSPSTSQTPQASKSPVASLGIVEEFHDIKVDI